jgi:pyruvate formate lyase activating enzyme
MKENAIDFEEFDIRSDGKDFFAQFYRTHRNKIFRDRDGVEFPVFTDGKVIRQGVSVVIGYLIAGDGLSGFISRSKLHGEWIDGFNLAGGNPENSDSLLRVMAFLKQNGLKIQIFTDGRNAGILESVLDRNLADRVIADIKGPAALYKALTGTAIDETELKRTIELAVRFPHYLFCSTVVPLMREDDTVSYLTPEEIAETARLIEDATGSKKHAYTLRVFDPQEAVEDRFKSTEPLPAGAMFKYRTAARRYMVLAEIDK